MALFTEILDEMHVQWKQGSRPGELNICCPFCVDRGETPDYRFRLGVNVITDRAHCFNCDYGTREGRKWILKKLGSLEVAGAETIVKKEKKEEILALPDDFELLHKIDPEDSTDPKSLAALYMLRRGFTRKDFKRYKIGVALTGRYAYRIVMPVYWRKKLRGIVARDFTGRAKAKYINSVNTKYLWNLNFAEDSNTVVLAEGNFKSIAIQNATQVQSAALLGHSITEKQMRQLKASGYSRIIVWPDPDKPGLKGLLAVCEALMAVKKFEVLAVYPAPSKQADELTPKQIRGCFKRRLKKVDWKFCTKLRAKISFM